MLAKRIVPRRPVAPSVLLAAAEAVPFAKTGGLGDVIAPLARSLAQRGLAVTLLLPGYPGALREAGDALDEVARLDDLPGGPGRLLHVRATHGPAVLLLATERFAQHEGPYADADGREHADNPLRFADLAHAVERVCSGRTGWAASHVVHLHDWHTALMPLVQRARGAGPTPSVITIHNLAFQGVCEMEQAAALGLGDDGAWRVAGEFWGRFNPLKAAIALAGKVTTVSRAYAQEILTPRFGCGLQGVLGERAAGGDLIGIANGIDTACWTPDTDTLLPANFGAASLAGKAVCKAALQRAFGLPEHADAPLLALGSRLTHQKMADVALEALPRALALDARLTVAVLGRGEPPYERMLRALADEHPGRIGAYVGYDEVLAHLLHAGSDLLLHGSRFEPFGLTPLYAMRYGSVPIVSRVGGIRDSIVDVDAPGAHAAGVLFDGESVDDVLGAIARGLAVYADGARYRSLQRRGMTADFGWARRADDYTRVYAQIVGAAERSLFECALRPAPDIAAIPQQQDADVTAAPARRVTSSIRRTPAICPPPWRGAARAR